MGKFRRSFRDAQPGQPKQKQASSSIKIRRKVEPGTKNQEVYVKAIKSSDVTVCNGLAGTGKTFLAVGSALQDHLLNQSSVITRLIVARPIVPAGGEDLGFLPGDLTAKTDPYIAPIYESLRKFCRDEAEFKSLLTELNDEGEKRIEVCPLAYMRGRTFDNAFVILDEAQNSTPEQMYMFLTRMGKNCKVVVTGDLTQTDLYDDDGDFPNGLELALRLEGQVFKKGKVEVCRLGREDIMRNDLIAEIIDALKRRDDEEDEDFDDREGPDGYDDDEPDDDDGGPYSGKPIRSEFDLNNRITKYRTNGHNGKGH